MCKTPIVYINRLVLFNIKNKSIVKKHIYLKKKNELFYMLSILYLSMSVFRAYKILLPIKTILINQWWPVGIHYVLHI